MSSEYKDKTVIVTGAGTGIGFALCQSFAQAGAYVALNDIDDTLAKQAAVHINDSVGKELVFPFTLDVADVMAVQRMVKEFASNHGRLDIVIANAGLTSYGSLLDTTVEDFDRLTSVNLRGSYFTAQAAAQEMIRLKTKDGRILLTSSVTGVRALTNLGAYGITKAGIRQMAKVLALELGPFSITVNSIAPGATLTERTLSDDPDYESMWAGVTPNGRVGQVGDIIATAMFLASSQARHITGQTIVVDGGWTLQSPMPGE